MTLDFDAIYILNTLGLLNEGFDKLTPNKNEFKKGNPSMRNWE